MTIEWLKTQRVPHLRNNELKKERKKEKKLYLYRNIINKHVCPTVDERNIKSYTTRLTTRRVIFIMTRFRSEQNCVTRGAAMKGKN